jgi:ADP-ribose pyrophosphatase
MKLESIYRYCPVCGVERASFEPSRPFRCHACGHTTFFGPVAAVGAIVTDESGKVLLVRRANDPAKGKLGMPGGFIDPGESSENGLRREMLEEVGLTILSMQYLTSAPNRYIYRGIELSVLDMFYVVQVEHRDIQMRDGEISDWIWTELSDDVLDQMAFASNRYALEFYRGRIGANGN